MWKAAALFLLTLVSLGSNSKPSSRHTDYCPANCLCSSPGKIRCDNARFERIPANLSSSLKHLTIRNSRLKSINTDDFKQYSRIQTIILDGNNIQHIRRHAFRGLKRLRHLQVQNNDQLRMLEPYSFSNIQSKRRLKIYLCHNSITSIEQFAFFGNRVVRTIDLRNNPTRTLRANALSGLHQVDFLYLPDSLVTIESRAFANLSGVHHMELAGWHPAEHGGVKANTFDFNRVRSLSVLRSDLGTIHPFAFSGVHTAKQIQIAGSRINRLRRKAFMGLRNVGLIHLTNNSIGRIDRHFFNYTSGVPVLFEMNQIHCSCRNTWMLQQDAYLSTTGAATLLRNNFCSSPIAVERLALAGVPEAYLRKCRRTSKFAAYSWNENDSATARIAIAPYVFIVFTSAILLLL